MKKNVLLLFIILLSFKTYAQPSCNTGTFYGFGTDGRIYELTISGTTVTIGASLSSPTGTTRLGLALASLDAGYRFYSTGSMTTAFAYDVLAYDGSTWSLQFSNPSTAFQNCGGHGPFLYYQYLGAANQTGMARFGRINRFTGSTLPVIYNDTTEFMRVADIAVDNSGNVYFFTDTASTGSIVSMLNIISSTGTVLSRIPVSFDASNGYGLFLQDSTLYVGLGPSNLSNPHTLLPITVSGNTATVGAPIPMPHPIIGGTVGNPTFLSFSDLASCAEAVVNFQTITAVQEVAPFAFSVNTSGDELQIHFSIPPTNRSSISLMDMNGRIISIKNVSATNETIDISALSNGVYLLQFNDGQKILTKKFIKN